MLKNKGIVFLGTALLAASTCSAFADDQSAPNLPDYYASPAPQAPLGTRLQNSLGFLQGFYVSGKYVKSYAHLSTIENDTVEPGTSPAPVIKSSQSGNVDGGSLAIGYKLRTSGIFSRFELEYTKTGDLNYSANPLLYYNYTPSPQASLKSSMDTQTLLLKTFYDIDLGSNFSPYFQVGAGIARNRLESNGTSQLLPYTFFPVISSSYSTASNQFAWTAGLGLRYAFTDHFLADLGYEYEGLGGKSQAQIITADTSTPTIIGFKGLSSNTFSLGLTLQI